MPAIAFLVQDPSFLELELSNGGGDVSNIDIAAVRAKIGLEYLERESITATSRGLSIHFRGPKSPSYQHGIQPVFVVFVPNTRLADDITPWRLLRVCWREK